MVGIIAVRVRDGAGDGDAATWRGQVNKRSFVLPTGEVLSAFGWGGLVAVARACCWLLVIRLPARWGGRLLFPMVGW